MHVQWTDAGDFVEWTPPCVHCQTGSAPTKLKRQWVHHDPQTGRIVVCVAHDLKPSGS